MKTEQLVDVIGQLDDAVFAGIDLSESGGMRDSGRTESARDKNYV